MNLNVLVHLIAHLVDVCLLKLLHLILLLFHIVLAELVVDSVELALEVLDGVGDTQFVLKLVLE